MPWERHLDRWQEAGLLDPTSAERIRAYERSKAETQRLRWPVLLAVSFGGLMLAAGVLLFVAAHWDQLSPSFRLVNVLLLVALFHVFGAFLTERFPILSRVLHAVGTTCLGAGIFLAAQIFNLEEDWSGGFMLWAVGAALGWLLLRHTAQGVMTALLVPIWLAGKWAILVERHAAHNLIAQEGLWLLACSYLGARTLERDGGIRRWLVWAGGLSLIPLTAWIAAEGEPRWWPLHDHLMPAHLRIIGWVVALGLPLMVSLVLRGRGAWVYALAAPWVLLFGTMQGWEERGQSLVFFAWHALAPYLWCLLAAVGMVGWGLREKRKERINLGIAGFGITVIAFYFSELMDKLSRSTSLMGLGVLFIVGGWFLETSRRRLVARLGAAT